MPKLPSVKGLEAVRVFNQVGFAIDRITGSHHIMKKLGHRYILSVPVHKGKDIKQGTLRSLIKDAGLSEDEFIKLL